MRLIRNLRLISKLILSSTQKQIITIHILTNISRSKCNQRMKFCQLIGYVRNIFLKKYTKCGGETSLRPFSKKLRLSIIVYFQVKEYQNILKLKLLLLLDTKAFLKNPRTSLPASFSVWFMKKNIYHVIFSKLTKFHCLNAFTC